MKLTHSAGHALLLSLWLPAWTVQAQINDLADALTDPAFVAEATQQEYVSSEAQAHAVLASATSSNNQGPEHVLLAPPSMTPTNPLQNSKLNVPTPDHLSDLTPAQTQQLIQQGANLTPEQMQALAKSYQQQQTNPPIPSNAQAVTNQSITNQSASQSARASMPLPTPHAMNSAPSATMTGAPATQTFGGAPAPMSMQAPGGASMPMQPSGAAPSAGEFVPPQEEVSLEQMKRDAAFSLLMQEVLPMSPDQIMKLHRFYDLTLQAKATPPNAPPEPHFTSLVVNLEPGSMPPIVRLAAGFVSSLIFIDATGAAWPITAYSIGDPQNFNIQWDQKSNALFVQSLKQYAHGNLAVRLWGLDTPVMVTLVSSQRHVDFRVDLQIAGGRGPDAKPTIVDTTFNAKVNPVLMNLLDGIPPKGSIKLSVNGGPGEAWLADSRVYFRTRLTVLSPAWTGTVASPDGTHVYELMQTPYILASLNGKAVDIKLSGL